MLIGPFKYVLFIKYACWWFVDISKALEIVSREILCNLEYVMIYILYQHQRGHSFATVSAFNSPEELFFLMLG